MSSVRVRSGAKNAPVAQWLERRTSGFDHHKKTNLQSFKKVIGNNITNELDCDRDGASLVWNN